MGKVIEIEEDLLGLDRYRRVKLMMNVTKPLRRFRDSMDWGGREVRVEFAYERLSFLCFACGVLGHSERDCQTVSEEDKKKGLGRGIFLRDSPRKGRGKKIEELATIT